MATKTSKTPQAAKQTNAFASLSDIFQDDRNLAWDILDSQSSLYTQSEVKLDQITHLASLYMRIIETLNGRQDQREGYFSFKMQKLMRQPFITRCFNQQVDNRKDVLQNRRKELEQRVEQESEKHGHIKVLEQAIKAQEVKEQNVRQKIKVIEQESNQQLEERIKRRNQMRQNRSTVSPKRLRERSWEYSQRTISSGDRSFDFNLSHSTEFELRIDEDSSFLRSLKREVAAEQEEQALERRLFKQKEREKE